MNPGIIGSFSCPLASDTSFAVVPYYATVGTKTVDVGLTVTSNGFLNQPGDVYLNWHALVIGNVVASNTFTP
jgi:hypothetical protein